MAFAEKNRELNDLLIDVGRSLLQYAVDAWPWTAANAESTRKSMQELAARQVAHVADIADLLMTRGYDVEFGTYPTEYTDLHYVSLDYFLMLLEKSQHALVAEIESALARCRDDEEAADLLNRLLQDQREIVKSLKELRQPAPSGV